jgi:uncharacterized protein (DUF2062 family)
VSASAADPAILIAPADGAAPAPELLAGLRARGLAATILNRAAPSGGAGVSRACASLARDGHHAVLVLDPAGADTAALLAGVDAVRAAAAAAPGCVAIAVRPPRSRGARWGRRWAGLGLWLSGGVWHPDPASPLVLAPTELASAISPRRGRVAWHADALVRAAWQGRAVVLCPAPASGLDRAGYPGYHCVLAAAVARLCLRRLWPWGRGPGDRRRLRALFGAHLSPGRAAGACALGAAMAVAPVPGLQMAIATVLAVRLRLNVPLTLALSNLSIGPLLAMWYAAAIAIGLEILDHRPLREAFIAIHHELVEARGWHQLEHALRGCLWSWLLGTGLLMVAGAACGGIGGYLAARWLRRP